MIYINNLPNFYSVLIPKVRYSRDISWFDKILFSEIVALTNVKGYCYAHNSYFQKVFDVSDKTVQRSIKRLEINNFIKTELQKAEKTNAIMYRKIYSIPPVNNVTTPPDKNDGSRARNNILKNNTSINNYVNKPNNFRSKNQKTDVSIDWINEYL